MRRTSLALITVIVGAASPLLGQAAEVMAPIRQFVDAFNKGDMKATLASCAQQVSIIDEFPPHLWHGAGACSKWLSDYDLDAKKNGISDGSVTLGTPAHVDVSGTHAYVIVPAEYDYKQKGKPVQETGSLITVVLQKGPRGWHITSWAWAKGRS